MLLLNPNIVSHLRRHDAISTFNAGRLRRFLASRSPSLLDRFFFVPHGNISSRQSTTPSRIASVVSFTSKVSGSNCPLPRSDRTFATIVAEFLSEVGLAITPGIWENVGRDSGLGGADLAGLGMRIVPRLYPATRSVDKLGDFPGGVGERGWRAVVLSG